MASSSASRSVDPENNTVQDTSGVSGSNGSTLLHCLQHMLKEHGLTYSLAAIRDTASLLEGEFGPKQAVEVLKETGFKSNFGKINRRRISPGMCPMIVFEKSGEAVVVSSVDRDGSAMIHRMSENFRPRRQNKKEFSNSFSGYAILAKNLSEGKSEKQRSWFFSALSQNKWTYSQVIIAAALSNFLGLSSSLFIMVVYDRVVPNQAIESLIALTIAVIIALGFDFIIKTLRAQFIDRAGKKADLIVSRRIFDKLLQFDMTTRAQNSGALASVVREFDTLRDFFTSATLVAIVDVPFIFFFIFVINLIAGPLAYVTLSVVPIVIIVGLAIQPFLAKLAAGSMETGMSKQAVLVETLNGIETVRATGSGRLMRKRFETATANQSELGLKNRLLSQFALNFAASAQQFAQIALIFYGVFLIQDGVITMGAMIAAVILSGRTLAPLSQLAQALTRANSARQAYRSLNAIMTNGDRKGASEKSLSRPELTGAIEFRNVTYTFPGANAPIVHDLSFKVPAGQKVAMLGKMGSGKSTIAKLASGLINPTEGSILLDGVDIRQINQNDLLRNVGVMLQDTWLFSGTVRENLQMGFFEYSDEHILEISKICGVDAFISRHPQGYDLQLREKGEGLSGGQRQSINLARALLHQPNLLIFDEPTSSMDTGTEKMVIENLRGWAKEKTILAVTHRNALLQLVDRVLVIDNGAVIADTTPEKLRSQLT